MEGRWSCCLSMFSEEGSYGGLVWGQRERTGVSDRGRRVGGVIKTSEKSIVNTPKVWDENRRSRGRGVSDDINHTYRDVILDKIPQSRPSLWLSRRPGVSSWRRICEETLPFIDLLRLLVIPRRDEKGSVSFLPLVHAYPLPTFIYLGLYPTNPTLSSILRFYGQK